jgi:hypothetical protein
VDHRFELHFIIQRCLFLITFDASIAPYTVTTFYCKVNAFFVYSSDHAYNALLTHWLQIMHTSSLHMSYKSCIHLLTHELQIMHTPSYTRATNNACILLTHELQSMHSTPSLHISYKSCIQHPPYTLATNHAYILHMSYKSYIHLLTH